MANSADRQMALNKFMTSNLARQLATLLMVREVTPATNGRTADVFDPATGKVNKRVQIANKDISGTDNSRCPKCMFPDWRNTPPLKRAQILFRFRAIAGNTMPMISAN